MKRKVAGIYRVPSALIVVVLVVEGGDFEGVHTWNIYP
jgi:hypothetical protein